MRSRQRGRQGHSSYQASAAELWQKTLGKFEKHMLEFHRRQDKGTGASTHHLPKTVNSTALLVFGLLGQSGLWKPEKAFQKINILPVNGGGQVHDVSPWKMRNSK